MKREKKLKPTKWICPFLPKSTTYRHLSKSLTTRILTTILLIMMTVIRHSMRLESDSTLKKLLELDKANRVPHWHPKFCPRRRFKRSALRIWTTRFAEIVVGTRKRFRPKRSTLRKSPNLIASWVREKRVLRESKEQNSNRDFNRKPRCNRVPSMTMHIWVCSTKRPLMSIGADLCRTWEATHRDVRISIQLTNLSAKAIESNSVIRFAEVNKNIISLTIMLDLIKIIFRLVPKDSRITEVSIKTQAQVEWTLLREDQCSIVSLWWHLLKEFKMTFLVEVPAQSKIWTTLTEFRQ